MKYKAVVLLLAAAACASPAHAQDPSTGSQPLRLSDIMGATQLRHIKLWHAGAQKNWPLAQYELGQIKESFQDAMTYYPGIPAADMSAMTRPATDMAAAITAKNGAEFVAGYNHLTAACNACHSAQGYGFIVVKVPSASPFSDQVFPPRP
jgi:cytochrome c556